MLVKIAISTVCIIAFVLAAVSMPTAQARGDRPAAATTTGTVEKITVHGKALEGNLEGDSPEREVTVYLPPTYAGDQARRYPVIYLLHGYGGRDDTFTARL